MSSAERVRNLRDLADRLVRLPATEERDSMLRKVRARAVDLDTGVTTRPGLSGAARKRGAAVAIPVAEPEVARAGTNGWHPRTARWNLPAVGDRVAMLRSSDVLPAGERLTLEAAPAPEAPALGPRGHGAWERGLRG
jgi:hypothetical protein